MTDQLTGTALQNAYPHEQTQRLASLVTTASLGKACEIQCPSGSKARSLRARFYKLAESFYPTDKVRLAKVEFCVVGRTLTIQPKFNWQESVKEVPALTQGEESVSENQG